MQYLSRRGRRSAFTIVELMISTVLMSLLLAATWALLGIYQGQFEKSQDRVERWQLIRSLQSQLTDDLKACHVSPSELEFDASEAFPLDQVTEGQPDAASSDPATRNTMTTSRITSVPGMTQVEGANNLVNATELAGESQAIGGMESFDSTILGDWMRPAIGLEGTPNELILDILAPPNPGDVLDTSRRNAGDRAMRVVYAFVDPVSAVVQGRPAGLVRCQLKAHELQSLFAANVGSIDLLALVQQIKSPTPEATPTTPSGESNSDDYRSIAASKLDALGSTTFDTRRLDKDVGQRIDLVPEMTSLSFSYYDGQQWHSTWSFSKRRQLPVVVEMRFDLRSTRPAEPTSSDQAAGSDPAEAAQRLLRKRNEVPVALERPTEDGIRSSQDVAPVGYRWLIYLGGNHQNDNPSLEQEILARD